MKIPTLVNEEASIVLPYFAGNWGLEPWNIGKRVDICGGRRYDISKYAAVAIARKYIGS